MGNLHFIYGPMSASKSAKLITDRYNFEQKGVKVFTIKPQKDRITDPKITSRLGIECPATVLDKIDLKEILKRREFYYPVYMIDEIQFFTPKDIDALCKLADTYNRLIFCFGLLVDVNERLFPASKHLVEVGAELHSMETPCQEIGCMNPATHHLRYTKNGAIIKSGPQVTVDDGKVVYKSVCRYCYDRALRKHR